MHLNFSHPPKPLAGIALAAVAGILFADRWPLPLVPLLGGAAVIALVALRWPRAWLCHVFAGVAFFGLHTLRHHHGPAEEIAGLLKNGPHPAEVTGVVWSEPKAHTGFRGEPRATFWLKVDSFRLDGREMPNPGMCVIRWAGRAPVYGDAVAVRGTARPLSPPTNPGEFDTAGWLRRHGIEFEVGARNEGDCEIRGHDRGSPVMAFAIAARAVIKSKLDAGLGDAPEVATLIESMVLGLRGETPPEMKGLFQKTGTLHLFAVSGLNVAMLAGIAWYLLKPLRFSRAAAFFVIMPVLAAYAVVTGLSPSCLRATVMAAFALAAPLFDRPAVPVNSMGAAAAAILGWDTNQLFTPGFQLSFVLVLCILAMTGPISRRLEPLAMPDDFLPQELWSARQRSVVAGWRVISQATAVTIAAWLGSLVFMAGYFHLVSPVAIVANAVAVPLAFLVLALGLMSLLAGLIAAPLGVIVNQANWLAAKLLLVCLDAFSRVPGGYVYVEVPRMERAPVCDVTVLEAGEGAAIHLRAGGGDWMLDCGSARDYEPSVLPYLRSRGVDRLDGLIFTHGDTAHISATRVMFDDFRPRWVADTIHSDRSRLRREIHADVSGRGFGRRYFERGDGMTMGAEVKLRVLYPPPGIVRPLADDKALVCRVEAAGARVLFVSDAGFFTEQWLLQNEPDLRADVLVKGWHSRDFSGTPDFIARVGPKAIVSSAMPFGTPAESGEEWERTARDAGAVLFRQERCGAVRIEILQGGEIRLRSFVGNQSFRSRAR